MISLKSWILTTFFDWLLGLFLLVALSGMVDSIGIENMQFYIGLGIGPGVGFAQWRVLRYAIGMEKDLVAQFGHWYRLALPCLCFDLFRFFKGRSLGTWYIPVSILLASALCGLVQLRCVAAHGLPRTSSKIE